MAKAIRVEQFAEQVARALGGRLVAFLLYGSTAGGHHVPGRSDVNTLLICDAADETLFDLLEPAVVRWVAAGHPGPLIFTLEEWRHSADAFPIEYEDIRHAHRLLAGSDPWSGIAVRREDLRRQLERELRGKVLRLRQAYAAARGDGRQLARVIAETSGGFLTMLRAALRLAGREAPLAPDALVRAGAELVGFDPGGLDGLAAHLRGERLLKLRSRDPLAAAYLSAVTRTAELVNRLA